MHLHSKARSQADLIDELDSGYPTAESAHDIHDEQDLQRAVDAYRFFYPSVSMECVFHGIRELGIADGTEIAYLAAQPHHRLLTASSDTPYSCVVLDLKMSGPIVIEMPAGPYIGTLNDHHQQWIADLGISGPDGGLGGKYVLLPPEFAGSVPAGYRELRSATYKVLFVVRALPLDEGTTGALAALRNVVVRALSSPKHALPYVDITDRPLDTTPLRWEGSLDYWRKLHTVLDAEPILERFKAMYGVLAALGVKRGKRFAPDRRMHRILEVAARIGLEQMRVEAFACERPERVVWLDRRWEWVCLSLGEPNFESADYLDLVARDRWFFQALTTSPAMVRREAGLGSINFVTVRDVGGTYLDGGSTYCLRIPEPVPARLFWSVTAYDAKTRSQIQTDHNLAAISSLDRELSPDADGAIEIFFGPAIQPDRRDRWILTTPNSGFFLYFRLYGPEVEAFDGSWRPGDLVRVHALSDTFARTYGASRGNLRSVATPDVVDSRAGLLRFSDGVPSEDTIAKVYDTLDHMHAVEVFLNLYQAASLGAIRAGLHDAGIDDNEVLLFSNCVDSRSMFLTADCDTVFFLSCLDLSHGPVVLEVPPGVFGAIDDMWFDLVTEFGSSGPDRGEGGRYLIVPDAHDGPRPNGFFACNANSDHVFVLGRAFIEEDDPAPAVARIRNSLHIYPYSPSAPRTNHEPHRPTRFVEGTGLDVHTIPPNDVSYYELVDAVIQSEPHSALDPELVGQLASIGICKGGDFKPELRMQKILGDAVALADATARTLGMRARSADAFRYYDASSAWLSPFGTTYIDETVSATRRHNGHGAPAALNARTSLFYMAVGESPALRTRDAGGTVQALAVMWDAEGNRFDGSKTYKLILPPGIPAARAWSLTLYDNQTRSMLMTEQRFPRVGSQNFPTPAAVQGTDGSTRIWIGPMRPPTAPASNWIETDPTKGWFAILRLYEPQAAFFDKTWAPQEIVEARPSPSP